VKQTNTRYPHVRKGVCQRDTCVSNSWNRLKIFTQRDCKCLNAFLAGALLFLLPGFAAAQGNLVRPRIADRVDDSRMAVLQGNTHPLARPQFDQGAAPPNLPMDRMMLVLNVAQSRKLPCRTCSSSSRTTLHRIFINGSRPINSDSSLVLPIRIFKS